MTLRLLISLNLALFLCAQKVCAQLAPADDFFNSGAQFYISNNIPAALERVEMGLKTYPDDEKLKKLEELLKQKNQQQQQQQNQSQPQKSDGQKNQQQKQNSQDQQKPDEQQKQAEQQKSADEKKNGDKSENQNGDGQPVKPGEMTKDEAKHLLDAQKDNEQILQMKPQAKPRDPDQPVRDW
jgi:Ca-activated chloride channel family protein